MAGVARLAGPLSPCHFSLWLAWASYQQDNFKVIMLFTWVLAPARQLFPETKTEIARLLASPEHCFYPILLVTYDQPRFMGRGQHKRMNNRVHGSLGSLCWRPNISGVQIPVTPKFRSSFCIRNIFFLDFNLFIRLESLIIPKYLQNKKKLYGNTKSLLSSSYQLFKSCVASIYIYVE